MRILSLVKRVPATGGRINLAADGRSIDTAYLGFVVSPHEECAVEEAVRLAESNGAETVVLTLGPAEAVDQLRDALAIGIDRAVVERMLAVYDAFSDDGLFKLRHTTQQHTISVCMQRQGPLKPAEQWFAHYWANKGGYQLAIDRQLSVILSRGLSVEEASEYCAAHPIERPLVFRQRWWHKPLRKIIPAWA